MRIKPIPKLIIIMVIVAAVGFGINTAMNKKLIATPVATVPVSTEPVQSDVSATVSTPAPTAKVEAQPESAPAANAGLAKLLQSKKQ